MTAENLFRKLIIVLFILGFYLPVAFVINYYWDLKESNRCYARIHRQAIVYNIINNTWDATGKIPKAIAELPDDPCYPGLLKECQKFIDYYEPNAWQNPQRIFFLHKTKRSCYVTFGDGSQTILRYWRRYNKDEENSPFNYLYVRVHWFRQWFRITFLGLVAIAIAILVTLRFKKG